MINNFYLHWLFLKMLRCVLFILFCVSMRECLASETYVWMHARMFIIRALKQWNSLIRSGFLVNSFGWMYIIISLANVAITFPVESQIKSANSKLNFNPFSKEQYLRLLGYIVVNILGITINARRNPNANVRIVGNTHFIQILSVSLSRSKNRWVFISTFVTFNNIFKFRRCAPVEISWFDLKLCINEFCATVENLDSFHLYISFARIDCIQFEYSTNLSNWYAIDRMHSVMFGSMFIFTLNVSFYEIYSE